MLTVWLNIPFKRLQKSSSPLQTGNSNAVIPVLSARTGPRAANNQPQSLYLPQQLLDWVLAASSPLVFSNENIVTLRNL